jgi:hypothetical protein
MTLALRHRVDRHRDAAERIEIAGSTTAAKPMP